MRRLFSIHAVAVFLALAAVVTANGAVGAEKPKPVAPTRTPYPPAPFEKYNELGVQFREALATAQRLDDVRVQIDRALVLVERLKDLAARFQRLPGVAADLLSGNRADLLSKNKTALLSGNRAPTFSGNKPKMLSENKVMILSGNNFSLFSGIKVEIHIANSGNRGIAPEPPPKP